MTDPHYAPEDHLDKFLDGLMSDAEQEAFEDTLREDPELRRQVELQIRIDGALAKFFPVEHPSAERAAEIRERLAATPAAMPPAAPAEPRPRSHWLVATVAAAMVCVVVAWWWDNHQITTPFFEPRPLAHLYREAVRNGFEPYYECREADRFAATFLRRQGTPLQLSALPPGSRMLGLSYPGGLSRQTTAMLCRVDEQPVMVFVDRLDADKPLARHNQIPGVHVFRDTREGLVFYEVTPFPESRMIGYLAVPTN